MAEANNQWNDERMDQIISVLLRTAGTGLPDVSGRACEFEWISRDCKRTFFPARAELDPVWAGNARRDAGGARRIQRVRVLQGT